jgi:BioD-like phosphotransacetylase family protein
VPIVYIASPLTGDGKSVLTVGLAHALRADGRSVQLMRLAGGGNDGADATTFVLVDGVRTTGQPIDMGNSEIGDTTSDLFLVEVPDSDTLAAARSKHPGAVIVVTRPGQADDATLNRFVAECQPAAIVLNEVDPRKLAGVDGESHLNGVEIVGRIPQDRLLSAPTVRAMAEAVDGNLSGSIERQTEAVTWLQIGPISAHGGVEHFSRHTDKAIVTRHDKMDVALSALDSEPACLILSGGEPNLPYVAQRAESEDFALIVTAMSTPDVANRIGDLYTHSPFRGRQKVDRAAALVREHVDCTAVTRNISH